MNIERGIKANNQISEEAAEWLVEFRSGDMDSGRRRGFDAWLRASPEHLRAFIEMAALWHESGSIDPDRKLKIEDLIVRANAESNVIDLDSGSSVRDGRPLHASIEPIRGVGASEKQRRVPRLTDACGGGILPCVCFEWAFLVGFPGGDVCSRQEARFGLEVLAGWLAGWGHLSDTNISPYSSPHAPGGRLFSPACCLFVAVGSSCWLGAGGGVACRLL